MPRKPVDYSKTHFYKIVCKNPEILPAYVGHTTDFTTRKNNHKRTCYNENDRHHNIFLYRFIRENGGWDNFEMILVKTLKCESSQEARQKEREFKEELNATLNQVKPFLTIEEKKEYKKQWAIENEERLIECRKQYHLNNKEKHNEYSKQYNQEHKEERQEYLKQYYQDNREEIREKEKIKYEENKEQILERNRRWRKDNKEQQKEYHKQYRENNKEKVAETKKKCYEKKKTLKD